MGERSGPDSKLMFAISTSETRNFMKNVDQNVHHIPGLAKGGGAVSSMFVLDIKVEDRDVFGTCSG